MLEVVILFIYFDSLEYQIIGGGNNRGDGIFFSILLILRLKWSVEGEVEKQKKLAVIFLLRIIILVIGGKRSKIVYFCVIMLSILHIHTYIAH